MEPNKSNGAKFQEEVDQLLAGDEEEQNDAGDKDIEET